MHKLICEAAQTKLLPAQTSTNDWACFGWIWACGGAEWPQKKTIKYYFNILKTEAAQTICFMAQTSTNGAQTNKTIFSWIWSMWGAGVTSSPIFQCKNRSNTNENITGTNEPVLGELGCMWGGGAGGVIAYNSMSNILKTEAAQMKLLPAQTSTNKRDYLVAFVCAGLCR